MKLVVAMLAGNCENTIDMALESVKNADEIYIIYDGNSKDNTHEKIFKNMETMDNIDVVQRDYDHSSENKIANSQARNYYLDILKEKNMGDYCLVIDADEVVEDFDRLKKWIDKYQSIFDLYPCASVKMRHFISDLGHEDATAPEHFVLHRLFKIVPELYYPDGEHPVLNCQGKEDRRYVCKETVVWHLGYVPNLNYYKERYTNHVHKSEIHSKQFLDNWYLQHILGQYPKSEVNPVDVPEIIWKNFGIDKDLFYFHGRGLEVKHFMMAKNWSSLIPRHSIGNVIEFGCGKAPYGYALATLGHDYLGIELSKLAVDNAFKTNDGLMEVQQGDITNTKNKNDWKYDLCLCIDVLEHLDDDQLDKAMKNVIEFSDKFIFSVPVIGDPNLMNDKTHKQFREKADWIKLWESHGLKITEAPKDWLFHEQLFIGEKI